MSQPQVAAPPKNGETPIVTQRITRVDLREVVSVADATAQSFSTDTSSIMSAKAAAGFAVAIVKINALGMMRGLEHGETWDGVRLSKVLVDRMKNMRQTHSAFIPKENVREIVYAPE